MNHRWHLSSSYLNERELLKAHEALAPYRDIGLTFSYLCSLSLNLMMCGRNNHALAVIDMCITPNNMKCGLLEKIYYLKESFISTSQVQDGCGMYLANRLVLVHYGMPTESKLRLKSCFHSLAI